MKVTDLNFALEKPKIAVLDFLCSRVSDGRKFQNVIGTDGMEGYGKSTITAADAYYMAYTLRRPLKLFFDIDAMNNYCLSSKDEIIIWDDVALAGLSLESYNQQIIKLIKILLLARKKRYTYFLNIQEVFRMKEPLVARMIAMNHVYSPDGLELGRYTYYNERQVRFLYHLWRTKKRKSYKYFSFKGSFPDVLYKVFDENEYESLKDKAIQSIQVENRKLNMRDKRLDIIQLRLAEYAMKEKKVKEVSEAIGIDYKTLYKWAKKEYIEGDVPLSLVDTPNNYKLGAYIQPKDVGYLSLPREKKIVLTNRITKPQRVLSY